MDKNIEFSEEVTYIESIEGENRELTEEEYKTIMQILGIEKNVAETKEAREIWEENYCLGG